MFWSWNRGFPPRRWLVIFCRWISQDGRRRATTSRALWGQPRRGAPHPPIGGRGSDLWRHQRSWSQSWRREICSAATFWPLVSASFFVILLSSTDQSTNFHYICRHTPPFQISAGHQRGLEVTGTGVRVDALGRPPCCLSLGIGLPKNSFIALVGQLSRPSSAIPSHFLDWNGMSDRQCSWVNMIASGADGYLLHLCLVVYF